MEEYLSLSHPQSPETNQFKTFYWCLSSGLWGCDQTSLEGPETWYTFTFWANLPFGVWEMIPKQVKRGFTNYQPKKLLKTSKTRFYKLPLCDTNFATHDRYFLSIFKCLSHFFWRNRKRFLNGTNAILKFEKLASR